jgi:MFS superfamily sulfate permease-like transporter
LSRAVLIGFVSGLGIQVFTNQARKILGVSIDVHKQLEALEGRVEQAFGVALETQGYFLEVVAIIREIPHANLYALAIGLGSLIGVRLMKRYVPKIPGALVVLILMTVIVIVFDLNAKGVSVLGDLPAGLPDLVFPTVPLADYVKLMPGALALVAITLCEGLLLAGGYAHKYQYKSDGNQLLFAYGMTNAAAGLTGSMVCGNSVSRSAAMDSAGAQSQLTSLVAAGVVAAILLYFTDMLALLPNAALAGIVANAVLSLIKVATLRDLFRVRRSEFWIAIICLLAVLLLGPLRAVAIAFLMSIIDLLRRASLPFTTLLRESAPGSYFISGGEGSAHSTPGLIVYRFTAPLYFANANLFSEEIEKLVAQAPTPVRWFVLDSSAIHDMDTTGEEAMRQVLAMLAERDVTFAITRASTPLQSILKDYGLLDEIGRERLYDTNRAAVAAFRREQS